MNKVLESRQPWRRALALLLLGVAGLIILFANYWLGAGLMGNMADRDFMTLWVGGKALMMGLDPFDPQVWPGLFTLYGSRWIPNLTCPYPLWTLIAFIPFSLLPLPAAVALLMTVSEMSLVWAFFLCIKAVGQPEGHLLVLSAFLGALLFRPFVASLTCGQLAPLLLLLLAGGISLYARGQHLFSSSCPGGFSGSPICAVSIL